MGGGCVVFGEYFGGVERNIGGIIMEEKIKIEVVEMDFTTACLFFASDNEEKFREEIRKLLSMLDIGKTAILTEELKATAHWPKCAMAKYIVDESEACYI